jgi:hypothetical protein
MSMQIRNIVLYGRSGEVRTIAFRLDEVNIITGKSRTGKTALLDIIDYCLGRNTCNVPEGVIRNTVAWYALVLQFPETQAFVARRNPEPDATTSRDLVFETAKSIELPDSADELVPNITQQGLTDALSRLIGIAPNENVPPVGQTRLPLRATLDHAKFLVFQGQSEIANRNILFHRQEEQFIPQAIRDTLPYFLGAVPDASLMLRARLRDAKQELARLQRQKVEAERIAGEGSVRSKSLLSEAVEVGLLRPEPDRDARGQLAQLVEQDVKANFLRQSYDFGEEANRLREELAQLRRQYQELQDQIEVATAFNGAQTLFEQEVGAQQARLEVVGLLPAAGSHSEICPLCQSELAEPVPAASDLQGSLRRLDDELIGVGSRRPRVDEYMAELRSQLQKVRQQMSEARQRLNAIESENQRSQIASNLEHRQSMVLGRISLYLESVPEAVIDEAAGKRMAALDAEITDIETQLEDETVREAVESALSRIGQWMTDGAHALLLEYEPNPYRLDVAQLTVVADTDTRPVRMSQMGSAENWLGCHLIAHVALQRWFATKNRPVPRFLFIDQPTSAYYPPDDPTQGTNEDREAVERMYRWLIETTHAAKAKFQLIIVDHADLAGDWFQACVIERWRGDDALIPQSWITSPAAPPPPQDET